MRDYSLSIQRFAYFLLVLVLSVYILVIGKGGVAPLVFASFFAALLRPLSSFFERLFNSRSLSIVLAFLTTLLPIAALIGFFSYQIVNVVGLARKRLEAIL